MANTKITSTITPTAPIEGVLFVPVVTRTIPQTLRFAGTMHGTKVVGDVIAEVLTRALVLDLDLDRTRGAGAELVTR